MNRSLAWLQLALACVAFPIVPARPLFAEESPGPALPRGVVRQAGEVAPGYTLFSPLSSSSAYLIDAEGRVVHQWESRYNPGLSPYLLPNGNLLRGIQVGVASRFQGGGISGGLQEFSWDGKLLWEFHLASDLHYHHHDIEPLPNGNLLMIAWEPRSQEELVQAGRQPEFVGDGGMWPEAILEIEPLRPYGARVVWEWHVWDHLVQDTNPDLPNYGAIRDHPERIDINIDVPKGDAAKQDGDRNRRLRTDWMHFNGIDYNAELDQIVVSSHALSEIWIIDHSTTTDEAKGSSGGHAGRGGDVLYRWGNPQNYQSGTEADRQLFHQHNAEWIPDGYPGAGHITVFNNGVDRSGGENYSTVVEIETPLRPDGTYARDEGKAFLPVKPVWEYNPGKEDRFFANFISGAHRLANGNTLICSGPDGRFREVTPDGRIVWEYSNPFTVPNQSDQLNDRMFAVFRATRIPPDHPALKDKVLQPLDPQPKTAEALLAEREPPAEGSEGWQQLDGLTALRWEPLNGEEHSPFAIERGGRDNSRPLVIAQGTHSGAVRSDRMYENFLMECEWRIVDPEASAGLIIWADPLPAVGAPSARGIRIDIADREDSDVSTSQGDIFPVHGAHFSPDSRFRSAGARSIPRESAFHIRPVGQWNHYRITAVDGSVVLEVNGRPVSGGSRCTPSKGYLWIASEGGRVEWRNPRIWELPAGSHAADAARTAQAAAPYRPLYNRANLDPWNVLSGDWKCNDWRLRCATGPGEIEIDLGEGADHVFFDFQQSAEAGDSGMLPFRIGEHRFAAPNIDPGKWHRVYVDFAESEVRVTVGDMRQAAAREGMSAPRLTLVGGNGVTDFSNVFLRGK